MLELLKHLKDLKSLVGPAYYGDLKDIALAALGQEWKQVHHLGWVLGEKVSENYLFPAPMVAIGIAEAELDAAFADLENATTEIKAAGEAQFDPTPYIKLFLMLAEFIRKRRENKNK